MAAKTEEITVAAVRVGDRITDRRSYIHIVRGITEATAEEICEECRSPLRFLDLGEMFGEPLIWEACPLETTTRFLP